MSRTRRWPWVVGAIVFIAVGALGLARVPDLSVVAARAKYASLASTFVTVAPGLAVHVRDEGPRDALPIVLLHGSSASLQTWEPWVARLKSRYRVVTLDTPGHGLTGADPRGDYSSDHMLAVIDAVVTARGLKRFVIGGNSMGGGFAAAYAVAHPERVAGLVLVDAGGVPYDGDRDLPLGFRIAATPVVRDIVKGITPRALIATSLEGTFSDAAKITPAMIDRYWELLRYPGNRDATIARFSTPWTRLDAATLGRFKGPVAIIWGRDDRLIPVAAATWFTRTLPQAKLTILDEVGHVPMEEAPDASLAPVLALLATLQADTPRIAAR